MRGRQQGRGFGRARAVGLGFLMVLSLVCAANGQSMGSFVAATTRSANGAILRILLGPDTTDAVAAAKALGRRADPYVGDILSGLFSRVTGAGAYRATLLLRMVLEYDFLLPSARPSRIVANAHTLTELLGQLQSLPDAETKGALLQISRYLPAAASEKPLLDEGSFLRGYLSSTGGSFAPDRLDEALAFVGACRAHNNLVLRSQVVTLVELSRNAAFVRAARAYLAQTR